MCERNINRLPLAVPQPGTWPSTQGCALTGDWTSGPLVLRQALNPLSHTSQGMCELLLPSYLFLFTISSNYFFFSFSVFIEVTWDVFVPFLFPLMIWSLCINWTLKVLSLRCLHTSGKFLPNTQLVIEGLKRGNDIKDIPYFAMYNVHPCFWPKLSDSVFYLFIFRKEMDYCIPGHYFAYR